jgi:predicted nucleic acid-binding protein
MHSTLVDSNVLIDVLDADSEWADRSASLLEDAARRGRLVINPLIFAEVSVALPSIEEVDALFPTEAFVREPLPWEAAFLAGQCFVKYRRSRELWRSPLPDFYIGAHAAVTGYTLLTRDARRYRRYFPRLRLISP